MLIAERTGRSEVVKSAGRVLDVLELIDLLGRPIQIIDVVHQLGYPQASAAALLRTLTSMGYLTLDARGRRFEATVRPGLLGGWLRPELIEQGPLLEVVEELRRQTGDTVVLACRNGIQAQYVHVCNGARADSPQLEQGIRLDLISATTGHALIAGLADVDVQRLANRTNADRVPEERVPVRELLGELGLARERGYAFGVDRVQAGFGMIAMLVPLAAGAQQMSIGVAAASNRLLPQHCVCADIIRRGLASFAG